MTVTVHLSAQLRTALGQSATTVTVSAPTTIQDVIQELARTCAPLRSLLIDATGAVRSGVLVFCNDEQIDASAPLTGDAITLMSAISGG